ncbi:MAG TPA: 2-C-methyl-D-erythritol 2,4-cyclodiphosphate synthase [Candidatus Krumholzibacteria bacterium]|nr:2-C-methyl-D-erythritol 2,4-cyclodiphosphate synthase [Candidatus Krumholzibacteria bacterium]HRX52588.1 2-C-methyl-D-erythritol 2,4-cyclodiphosphate synthase [Candidatus Krumholzibacteria bacterium]
MRLRIGQGWDRHRLEPGLPCILGGVLFEDAPAGPVAHSDGDVAAHAVADALLGAASLGDLGRLFPDTDPAYAGADSLTLLADVAARVRAAGWRLVNADLTVICEAPRIAPRAAAMAARLAAALGVPADDVSIKATRGEGLGPEGRGEAITVQAVVLLSGEESGS